MAIGDASVPEGVEAFKAALTHPRVVGLAHSLKIDLGNEAQRNAVLSQAARNFAAANPVAPAGEDGAVALLAPGPALPLYRAAKALQAYREIAAL